MPACLPDPLQIKIINDADGQFSRWLGSCDWEKTKKKIKQTGKMILFEIQTNTNKTLLKMQISMPPQNTFVCIQS